MGDDPRWIITVWVALMITLTASVWYFTTQPLPWLP